MICDSDDVEVMEPVEGKTLLLLQTCTLPDYEKRLIVDRSTRFGRAKI
jgi:sortase A